MKSLREEYRNGEEGWLKSWREMQVGYKRKT